MDDVIVKPISPMIVVSKLMAWLRRSWILPTDALMVVTAGKYRLVPMLRSLVGPNEVKIKLTNLEFRPLHLLMSHPGSVFMWEDIIDAVWGGYENGDHVHLKNVVYRLRKKIEADPSKPAVIQTMPGGYSFQG